MNDRRRAHNRRNADRDYRHAEIFPRHSPAVVADAGTRMNSCIRQLNGACQTVDVSRRQRVDRDHQIRAALPHDAADNFCRLHPCLCHHPRMDTAENRMHRPPRFLSRIEVCAISSAWLRPQMAVHRKPIHHARSQRIRRHLPVSQSRYQNRKSGHG